MERAYLLGGSDQEWLQGVCDAARPLLDHGLGISAYVHESRRAGAFGMPIVVTAGITAPLLEAITAANRNVPRESQEALGTLSGLRSNTEILGRPPDSLPPWHRYCTPVGIHDCLGLNALVDPSGSGCHLAVLLPKPMPRVPPRLRHTWNRIGAHLGAGMRLRRALTESPEAVLSPSGKIEHAEGAARDGDARQRLREAALRMDRARGRLRRSDPDEALDLWRGLVSGHWSLVDRFESDGRRYLVARRNAPGVIDPRALNPRERQVAWYASLGHANKLIAYELGIGTSSVALHLGRAAAKLGLGSRAELIALVRRLGASRKAPR